VKQLKHPQVEFCTALFLSELKQQVIDVVQSLHDDEMFTKENAVKKLIIAVHSIHELETIELKKGAFTQK
jgi:hypothetical protein